MLSLSEKNFVLRAAVRLKGDRRAFCQWLAMTLLAANGYGRAPKNAADFCARCDELASFCPELFAGGAAAEPLFAGEGESVAAMLSRRLPCALFIPEQGGCVENVGALYQVFQSARRSELSDILSKKTVASCNISTVTQLFTPPWVARYMLENSLGRCWLQEHRESTLQLRYWTGRAAPAQREGVPPSALRLLDPCCGSGNLLCAAFDLLLAIYGESGVPPEAAVKLILEQNLSGLDLDPLMLGLTRLALLVKAAGYAPSLLQLPPKLRLAMIGDCRGSLLAAGDPELPPDAAALLAEKYDVVVANPPYLRALDRGQKLFLRHRFPEAAGELFAAFIFRDFQLCRDGGYAAFMTPNVWLAIRSYAPLRRFLLAEKNLVSFVQMARGAYYEDATVDVCAFVGQNSQPEGTGFYVDLRHCRGNMDCQEQCFLANVATGRDCYQVAAGAFEVLPTRVLAFWLTRREREIFAEATPWGDLADVRQGIATADNECFLRYWFECAPDSLFPDCASREASAGDARSWYPYNKGGAFRRWYGNDEYVIDYGQDGAALRASGRAVLRNPGYWFRPCISWSLVSSGRISFRYKDGGQLFDVAGMSCFGSEETLLYLLALGNSCLMDRFMAALAPTVNYQVGNIKNIPVLAGGKYRARILALARENVALCRADWDEQELSRNFQCHPWLEQGASTLREAAGRYAAACDRRFVRLRNNEEELNRLLLAVYELEGELSPTVADKDVSVRSGDIHRDLLDFLAFTVGCLLGRYPVLGYRPRNDSCLVLGHELETEVVNFLVAVFGADTLAENLAFVAEVLGVEKGEDGKVALNRYFARGFYREHCRRYHYRPVYWLFDSGRRHEFRALVWCHGWCKNTIAEVAHKLASQAGTSAERMAYAAALKAAAAVPLSLVADDGIRVNHGKVQALAPLLAPLR